MGRITTMGQMTSTGRPIPVHPAFARLQRRPVAGWRRGRRAVLRAGAGLGMAGFTMAGLAGCASLTLMPPLPSGGGSTSGSRRLLAAAAEAQGVVGFRRFYDLNIAVTGLPAPALADDGGGSWLASAGAGAAAPVEIRGLLRRGLVAGYHGMDAWLWRLSGDHGLAPGPALSAWRAGQAETRVATREPLRRAIELLWVGLLGPLAFIDRVLDMDEVPPLWIDGRRCAGLRLRHQITADGPAAADFLLFSDPVTGLARRVGYQPAGDQLWWIDCEGPVDRHGVRWPSRFTWWAARYGIAAGAAGQIALTGLDVDRIYAPEDLSMPGPPRGRAAVAARAIGAA